MRKTGRSSAGRLGWLLLATLLAVSATLSGATRYSEVRAVQRRAEVAQRLYPRLGRGLGLLMATYHDLASGAGDDLRRTDLSSKNFSHVQRDPRHRVLVDIYLEAGQSIAGVRKRVRRIGGRVLAQVDWYRNGLVTAWVPLKGMDRLASTYGIGAVNLAVRPQVNAGRTTSQGAVVHHTDVVNQLGYRGAGITVGVLSDSFDADTADRPDPGFTRAAADVTSGDLPGTGNPDGYTSPVNVLAEGASGSTDEGRAMLQIVHDLAPASRLAFATSGSSESTMANNIDLLRISGGCQVICDDIIFFSEPMFSDGVVAQAVDRATATGGISYFSAAGNNGNSGYAADFNPIAAAAGLTQAAVGGVNVSSIPSAERNAITQWQGFGTDSGGSAIVVQNITTGADTASLVFQWDDPFDVSNGVTADFDILVFSAAGAYQSTLSGTELNRSTREPLELPSAKLSASTNYKICIVLTNRIGNATRKAGHLRYVAITGDAITGDYITPASPTTFGHSCAATAVGVGAYDYDIVPTTAARTFKSIPEAFSSNGPVQIWFDSQGNRLASPILRKQPAIAAVDGVNTSFFPPSPGGPSANDFEGDGFPNFSGTSAAAPHAAAIAALLLNAAATSGLSVSPADIRSILINSARKTTDQDPFFCSATAGPVTITANGDTTNASADSPNFFHVSFTGMAGQVLSRVTIDLSPVGLHFDTSASLGLPFTPGTTTGAPAPAFSGTPTLGAGATGSSTAAKATVTFSNFNSGDTLNFGVDRDEDLTNTSGNGADEIGGFTLAGGGTITATVNQITYAGTFANQLSGAYNCQSGYGLLDASAALNYLLGL